MFEQNVRGSGKSNQDRQPEIDWSRTNIPPGQPFYFHRLWRSRAWRLTAPFCSSMSLAQPEQTTSVMLNVSNFVMHSRVFCYSCSIIFDTFGLFSSQWCLELPRLKRHVTELQKKSSKSLIIVAGQIKTSHGHLTRSSCDGKWLCCPCCKKSHRLWLRFTCTTKPAGLSLKAAQILRRHKELYSFKSIPESWLIDHHNSQQSCPHGTWKACEKFRWIFWDSGSVLHYRVVVGGGVSK